MWAWFRRYFSRTGGEDMFDDLGPVSWAIEPSEIRARVLPRPIGDPPPAPPRPPAEWKWTPTVPNAEPCSCICHARRCRHCPNPGV